MNWDAIAAVGELVGSLAVIASLLYLAIQIRTSNRIARGESQLATHDVYGYFSQILDDRNRRILVMGLSDYESLTSANTASWSKEDSIRRLIAM
jgi:hypothetical protein